MLTSAAAVGLGAAAGALLRWRLSVWLNPLSTGVPPGTLVANVAGGYLVGLAVAWFAEQPGLAPEWKLFVITGFLGGLTTFSALMMETLVFARAGRGALVPLYLGVTLVGGMLLVWLGARLAEATR